MPTPAPVARPESLRCDACDKPVKSPLSQHTGKGEQVIFRDDRGPEAPSSPPALASAIYSTLSFIRFTLASCTSVPLRFEGPSNTLTASIRPSSRLRASSQIW